MLQITVRAHLQDFFKLNRKAIVAMPQSDPLTFQESKKTHTLDVRKKGIVAKFTGHAHIAPKL